MRIAVVCSRFNKNVCGGLLHGAKRALRELKIRNATVIRVPGAFEIPVVAKKLVATRKYDAVVCLGAIIKGETRHDEYLAHAVTQMLSWISFIYGVPVTFGIITALSDEQAMARARRDRENRGYQAARAAVEMIRTLKRIK